MLSGVRMEPLPSPDSWDFSSLLSQSPAAASDRCAHAHLHQILSVASRNAHAPRSSGPPAAPLFKGLDDVKALLVDLKMWFTGDGVLPPAVPSAYGEIPVKRIYPSTHGTHFARACTSVPDVRNTEELAVIDPPLFLYSPGKNRSANRELRWDFGGPSGGKDYPLDGACLTRASGLIEYLHYSRHALHPHRWLRQLQRDQVLPGVPGAPQSR